MKLKPVRFIGHKIGPFQDIELVWEKDSHNTLIVGENGMGKTTLVAAMAACLAISPLNIGYPRLKRFIHNLDTSFVYFELSFENQTYKLFLGENPQILPPQYSQDKWDKVAAQGEWSSGGYPTITTSWEHNQHIKILAAAYGVGRELKHAPIKEVEETESHPMPLSKILDPFASINSIEIWQWVSNQYVYHALALADKKIEEAQAYLNAIKRIEKILAEDLSMPIKFDIKRNPFRLRVNYNDIPLAVDQLSDGTRSFLSWTLDYLMRASRVNWVDPKESVTAPGLVLVDEIDAHLHPEWQRRIMGTINVFLPETYIIATTHSPFILATVDNAQIFQLYRNKQGKLDVKASYDQLYGYPADVILEKTFVPSLYPPEVEKKLEQLNNLARIIASGEATHTQKENYHQLLQALATVNTWLNNLLVITQTKMD